jgi:hypothetical protein
MSKLYCYDFKKPQSIEKFTTNRNVAGRQKIETFAMADASIKLVTDYNNINLSQLKLLNTTSIADIDISFWPTLTENTLNNLTPNLIKTFTLDVINAILPSQIPFITNLNALTCGPSTLEDSVDLDDSNIDFKIYEVLQTTYIEIINLLINNPTGDTYSTIKQMETDIILAINDLSNFYKEDISKILIMNESEEITIEKIMNITNQYNNIYNFQVYNGEKYVKIINYIGGFLINNIKQIIQNTKITTTDKLAQLPIFDTPSIDSQKSIYSIYESLYNIMIKYKDDIKTNINIQQNTIFIKLEQQLKLYSDTVKTILEGGDISNLGTGASVDIKTETQEAFTAIVNQVQYLSLDQIAQITPAQIATLNKCQILGLLNISSFLSASQISAIGQDILQFIPIEKIQSLLSSGKLKVPASLVSKLFTNNNLNMLDSDSVQYINPQYIKYLSFSQIQSLSKEQIESLTIQQITDFTKEQIQALTKEQFGYLSTDQLNTLSFIQINALSNDNFIELLANGFKIDTKHIKHLNNKLIQFLPTSLVPYVLIQQIKYLTPDQISNLTPIQINNLNSNILSQLTPDQLNSLDIAKILPKLIQSLSIQSLNSVQLNLLTEDQINAMTSIQIKSITTEQLDSLETNILQLIKNTNLLTREQLNYIALISSSKK